MVTNVLLLESDADLRSAIVSTLESADCRCDAVSTADDALLRLRKADYSYILIDLDSPAPTAALRRRLAGDPLLMAKVVVICDTSEAPEGMAGQPLLRKPFERSELLNKVHG